jgi:plasmid stability protein
MPRRISPVGKPIDAAGTELKAVRVELSPAVHKQLRLEAARQDRSMAALVRVIIEAYLSKRKPRGEE